MKHEISTQGYEKTMQEAYGPISFIFCPTEPGNSV